MQGFILGGSHSLLSLYERSEDPKEPFILFKRFAPEGTRLALCTLAVAPAEDTLACFARTNRRFQLLTFPLANIRPCPRARPPRCCLAAALLVPRP